MGFWGEVFSPFAGFINAALTSQRDFSASVPVWQNGKAQLSDNRYQTYAREGYMKNELVFACIEELATSAAEPKMMARSGQTWRPDGQICDLLNAPNPFMDRFEFWATIIMHRSLAGNAYALKVRSSSGRVLELWLLRPDRVSVVPSRENYIGAYRYDLGAGEVITLAPEDVIHFKTRHPVDDWYGMPPLMPLSGRVDIDNYMKDFVKSAFQNGGMPGAVLSVKQKLNDANREEIRSRFRNTFGGPAGWHELLILDNAESSYTPMTMQLGQRGLVVPDLDDISVERICSAFHVPPPLVGYMQELGGYNSLFALERHWWTSTLMPLYKELAGPLNRSLVPDFPRVSEVAFDMSDIWALREDMDALATRWANLAQKGIASLQEAREKVGLPGQWENDAVFLVPVASAPMQGDMLDEPMMAEPAQLPESTSSDSMQMAARAVGRPRLVDDADAKAVWEELQRLRQEHPGITFQQASIYLSLSVRTLQRYDRVFGS